MCCGGSDTLCLSLNPSRTPEVWAHHHQEPSLPLGAGKGKTPWSSVPEDRNKGAAPGCGLRAEGGSGCRAEGDLDAGQLSPRRHPGACPYQALADPTRLLSLQQVLELLPLEELGSSKEGFPRGLHNSRSCDIAPWLAKETSWLCSWGNPVFRMLGYAFTKPSGGLLRTALGSGD